MFLRPATGEDFREELEEVINELMTHWGWTPYRVNRAVAKAVKRSQVHARDAGQKRRRSPAGARSGA